MVRRRFAVLALGFLLLSAGCLGSRGDASIGGQGQFHAVTVSQAPPNATVVPATDERVEEDEFLRRVVRRAVNRSEAVVTVPEAFVSETKAGLARLPRYTVEESNSTERWGYYVRSGETVVNVQFVVLE